MKESLTGNVVVSAAPLKSAAVSPLAESCQTLHNEISLLQEAVDVLFTALSPVLAPEHPTDSGNDPQQAVPARSEHVAFLTDQADRVAYVRTRLNYLKNRLEV